MSRGKKDLNDYSEDKPTIPCGYSSNENIQRGYAVKQLKEMNPTRHEKEIEGKAQQNSNAFVDADRNALSPLATLKRTRLVCDEATSYIRIARMCMIELYNATNTVANYIDSEVVAEFDDKFITLIPYKDVSGDRRSLVFVFKRYGIDHVYRVFEVVNPKSDDEFDFDFNT